MKPAFTFLWPDKGITIMNPKDFILYKTGDGSETLYSNEMQESYHSLNGAVQESRHVFIDAGLKQSHLKTIQVFEVGFGTGLNALLTWAEAKKSRLNVSYWTVEAYPLPIDTISALGYGALDPVLPENALISLHEAAWGETVTLEKDCFKITKIQEDFTNSSFKNKFDLIYYDAFAPDKQPGMWEEHLFARLFENMNENGILVTYCAKGEVRRRLQRSGFKTERIPGPPGKREMIRASKPALKREENRNG